MTSMSTVIAAVRHGWRDVSVLINVNREIKGTHSAQLIR
jgi:hypothetical protein